MGWIWDEYRMNGGLIWLIYVDIWLIWIDDVWDGWWVMILQPINNPTSSQGPGPAAETIWDRGRTRIGVAESKGRPFKGNSPILIHLKSSKEWSLVLQGHQCLADRLCLIISRIFRHQKQRTRVPFLGQLRFARYLQVSKDGFPRATSSMFHHDTAFVQQ